MVSAVRSYAVSAFQTISIGRLKYLLFNNFVTSQHRGRLKTNWSPSSTAAAAISASATTTTDCRTAFTTAATDTSNPYSPPSVCTTTIPTSILPENGTSSFPKTNVSTSTASPSSPSTARNWCGITSLRPGGL